MQEWNPNDQEKICGSKYELEIKCTYGVATVNQTQAHWFIASGNNRYAACFPIHYH